MEGKTFSSEIAKALSEIEDRATVLEPEPSTTKLVKDIPKKTQVKNIPNHEPIPAWRKEKYVPTHTALTAPED